MGLAMEHQSGEDVAEEVSARTGRNPVVLAAAGSVLLAWYQFYIVGNKERGLFIGLWPPTMLAFSNTIRINEISEKIEGRTSKLFDWLAQD